ncbi:DUF2750 domain-containing protein [Runella sp. MFBS21]|uniref:DUF2750 domain-containing protein n=1 Tax=Runella sp. MFBS21 TaxID=3034018 RepID=UPI0023F915CC|nr:DUF2750 domain-containing protein [Runella sp. MFBS21]MDF7822270.1 DUF2750 domain-containing protein [Runella sp. MFBS21]
MKVTPKEIESVSNLSSFDRYKYFIKRVADFEVMYALVDERGSFAISEIEDNIMLSFWSAQEFAAINAVNEWQGYEVKKLTLEEFENEVIDIIAEKNYLLNIFPINNKTGFVVNIDEFARDLASEMKKYN